MAREYTRDGVRGASPARHPAASVSRTASPGRRIIEGRPLVVARRRPAVLGSPGGRCSARRRALHRRVRRDGGDLPGGIAAGADGSGLAGRGDPRGLRVRLRAPRRRRGRARGHRVGQRLERSGLPSRSSSWRNGSAGRLRRSDGRTRRHGRGRGRPGSTSPAPTSSPGEPPCSPAPARRAGRRRARRRRC